MNAGSLRWVLALFSSAFIGSAFAGYAQLQPPPGYSGTPATGFKFGAVAANGDAWVGSTVRTNAALNVGGQAVKMPVTMRLAANAGRFAAAAAFGWPGLFLAAGVAAYGYFQAEGYQAQSDGWYKSRTLPGTQLYQTSNYCTNGSFAAAVACARSGWLNLSNVTATTYDMQHPTLFHYETFTYTIIPGTPPETFYDKLTQQQFEDGLSGRPFPSNLPEIWPATVPVEWPVEVPVLNPSPAGVPQPLRVPTGDPVPIPLPVPNPNNEPQRWMQPVTDIVPSPTLDNPWRVDVAPKELVVDSPSPWNPAAPPVPIGQPVPVAEQPLTDCDKLPGSVGCSPMGTVSDPAMPPVPVLYTPVYPEGLAGVWAAKKAELTATPLMSTVSSLMPAGFGGGTCPHWALALDIGPWNYGSYDVAPPCWLWDVAKAIVIISALMLARSLIFGG